jgi:hypothetical protein
MTLTPTLVSPADVMAKLAREHARAVNGHESAVIADHLYNFCITSLAVRDHVSEHLGLIGDEQRRARWNAWKPPKEVLVAHAIGNSCKHLVLRDRRSGQVRTTIDSQIAARPTRRHYASVNDDGTPRRWQVPSVAFVIVIEGMEYDLWAFMSAVREFWDRVFEGESIPYEKLPHRVHLPFVP